MIRCIAVEGYRSLRSVYVPVGELTVVTGGNGSGKSSLYRVLSLLAATARAEVIPALAREGGWSPRSGPVPNSSRPGCAVANSPCRARCAEDLWHCG